MTFLKSKSGIDERPSPVWFVVQCEPHGAVAYSRETRTAALAAFSTKIATDYVTGEPYTPFQRGRRLSVVGPDVHVRAEDDYLTTVLYPMPDDADEDPPLIGPAALMAVLDPEEYRYVVHGPVASALLES